MNPNKLINSWLEVKQHEYEVFLDSLFIGKSIKTLSFSIDREWRVRNIKNIMKVRSIGYFNPEITITDSLGITYTLSNTHAIVYISNV